MYTVCNDYEPILLKVAQNYFRILKVAKKKKKEPDKPLEFWGL